MQTCCNGNQMASTHSRLLLRSNLSQMLLALQGSWCTYLGSMMTRNMKNKQLVTIAAAVLCPEGVLANVAACSGVNSMLERFLQVVR